MNRALVVLDCNVYLDVARLAGESFTSDRFHKLAVELAPAPVPHPEDAAADSLRLIAACQSGRLSGERALQIWSTTHIRSTVIYKAAQSAIPDPLSGHRGLGLSQDEAYGLAENLLDWIVDCSGGEHLESVVGAMDNPPLDHEDGTVYGACRHLEGQNPLDQVFCVTRDKGFLRASQRGELSGQVEVVTPAAMLTWVRKQKRGALPNRRRTTS